MNDLSIIPLRTFVTIADAGSYTRAAEQLYLTQPALSLQIKRLEEQIGQALFKRKGRQTVVTDAGEVLLGYARQILSLNEEAVSRLSVADTEGKVRIGVLEEVAVGPLVDLLTMFGRLCTRVRIEFEIATSWELGQRLAKNDLELAVLNRSFAPPRHVSLWDERYVWVERSGSDHYRLSPLRMIMESPDVPCALRDDALRVLAREGKQFELVFSTTSLVAVRAAVLSGLGIGLLSLASVTPEMRILGPSEGMPEIPRAPIVLAKSQSADSEACETLGDFLISHLRSEPVESVE